MVYLHHLHHHSSWVGRVRWAHNGLIAAAIGVLSMLMSEPTAKSYVKRTCMFVLSIATFAFTFTTLCVHHAFLYISLPSLHYSSRRENAYSRFVEDVNAGPRLSLSFPELWYSLLELNPRKNCQHLTNWKRWAKGDKVWSSAASLFEWRFRSRRRSCCLSSQLINHLHVGVSAKTVASE